MHSNAEYADGDSVQRVIEKINEIPGGEISVPLLGALLGVKPGTINAKIRRNKINVYSVGRTNYIPKEYALNLAKTHECALRGYLTLEEISEKTGIKKGTLKARCENGIKGRKIDARIDLTKKWRISPYEIENLFCAIYKRCCGKNSNDIGKNKKALKAKTVLWNEHDYTEKSTPGTNDNTIAYNPDSPPLLDRCKKGMVILYFDRLGIIEEQVLEDEYRPQIKVHFPAEKDKKFQRLNLIVRRL